MESDNGAFMEKFTLAPSSGELPLSGLIFAVKDIFDVEGFVTGFGNPDWGRTHTPAKTTAPAVLALLGAGATSIGKTVMDEMAYSINGENVHYGTPRNPCAADRIPGGSSSGSAVAVGANIVNFSLGTDTGGSVRVPAAFCNIYGIRPSHGVVSVDGVIPMAQSFDIVGRVCVPIDPNQCEDFDPTSVPTLSQLLEELNRGGLSGDVETDMERTSLGKSIAFFRSSFLQPLLKSCKEELEDSYNKKLQQNKDSLTW